MGSEAESTDFRLLGPVEAVRNGTALALGGARQKALLALLLLEPGQAVGQERLCEELWQGRPPAGAETTLRTYVSRLRHALGEAAPIRSAGAGYALEVAPERIDAHRFQHLLAEGERALARGAAARAAERLRSALELWRGRPFAGLADEGALRAEADRLEELRLRCLEERLEAELALGKSAELVEELETLVSEDPYRERLWRQLMLALYRSGRQADALAAYRRARTLLDEELGLEPGEELQALERAILRHEVPPAHPPEERHNLPAPLSSFVGRETELAEIEQLLAQARLVTLTGVGGVGKTRLALAAARRALPDYAEGVCFLDLAPLSDATLVPSQLAAALELREQPDRSLEQALVSRLRDTELLLLFDNCEHLREACAELAQTLLAACPLLRVLATSREPLGLAGEVDYPVPPLLEPEAVRLFLARARETRPRLPDDEPTLASAAQICRELDGLPLAIELAAARAKALSLQEIASRLADRFRFLVSWRRLTPARHRTLKEAIDWSYELLSEEDRTLLARLSVFAGGFTLAAAAGVCLEGDEERALALVERLFEASLLLAEQREGETRYRLLETVRQYAAEKLAEAGEAALFRRAHADYFLSAVEAAWEMQTADLDLFVELVGRERDNLRAALVWSRDAGQAEHLLRLAKGLFRFWWVRGDVSEGRSWLDLALESGAALDPALRAEALEGAAGLAWAHGDFARAGELATQGHALFAAVGDRRGQGACLNVLGLVAQARQDFRAAEALFQRYREVNEKIEDEDLRTTGAAVATLNLGSVALDEGDFERAARRYKAALSLYGAADDQYGAALSKLYLGHVMVETRRLDEAAEYLAQALPMFREMGFLQYTAECLESIAAVVHAGGLAEDAVRLLGAADAVRERTGNRPAGVVARVRGHELAALRRELHEGYFEAAWAEGRALREDQALDRAQRLLG
jgi:predicted ATPase/DNA-binding SARP family transcriptional activator